MNLKLMQIQTKIEALTADEDERQDLWVAILQTPNVDPEEAYLNSIREASFNHNVSTRISQVLQQPPSQRLTDTIAKFTEFEQSVMFMMMLGFTLDDISRYKLVRPLRLMQTISTIASHPIWEAYFAEETTTSRREIRTNP